MSKLGKTIGVASLLVAAVVFQTCAVAAPAEQISCPASITSEQKILNLPASWQTATDTTTHRLSAVTFYDGPPEQKASLVNDLQSQNATQRTATWKFPSNPRGYWLACSYDRTAILLTRKLPSNVGQCHVVYDTSTSSSGLPAVKSINCQ